MSKKGSSSLQFFLIGVIGILGCTYFLATNIKVKEKEPQMVLSFLDVGQGDATYLRTPGGKQMLVDGGRGGVVMEELGDVMPFFGRSLDAVFLTHPDADHAEGLFEVMKYMSVDRLFDTGFPEADKTDELYYDFAERYGISRDAISSGDQIILDEEYGVTVDILWPPKDFDFSGDINESSLVLLVRYGEFSVILTGDAGISTEQKILREYKNDIDVDILKIGHHGSKTSSLERFLIETSPDIAVASAGRDNPYGHPHKSVTKRLFFLGIPLLCTCSAGRVTFVVSKDGSFEKKKEAFLR